jgi:hypothetical protein
MSLRVGKKKDKWKLSENEFICDVFGQIKSYS